jgi:type III pantothenate kinase
MLLTIDIGNTNVVAALFTGERLLPLGRIFTDSLRTGDEYGMVFRALLRKAAVNPRHITASVLSSVVPALIGPFVGMVEALTGQKPLLVNAALYHRLPLTVPPNRLHTIGTDIVCNALEAWCRLCRPCVIVDFGTALSFTAVAPEEDAPQGDVRRTGQGDVRRIAQGDVHRTAPEAIPRGRILGTAYAPGLGTAAKTLAETTAQLPRVELAAPPGVLGGDTVSAMQAGLVHGYVGMAEYLVARMKAEMPCPPGGITVVATGGLCRVIQPLTRAFDTVDQELVLKGMRRVADCCG